MSVEQVLEVILVAGLLFENWQLRRQVAKDVEMLAARSYPEYQTARRLEQEPRKLTPQERERIVLEEQLKAAEQDPYSQA